MALTKQFLKSKPLCKVTFEVPAETANGGKVVNVVGDFNNWDITATSLKKQKDGSFKAIVELGTNQEYQFRYVIDNQIWANENQADKFVPSGVSADENSVVVC
jgi:1,4-alpha-glucan branching enzyme